ncbi:MAG: hypothetical protein RR310_07015 [Eubacterium sp.]
MKKKTLIIGVVFLAIASIILTFGSIFLSESMHNKAPKVKDKTAIVGIWNENDTKVKIEFTKDGKFKMMDSVAANYTIDDKNKVINYKYTETYSGAESSMSYALDGDHLILTSTQDGQSTSHYTRSNEEKK